jgi:peptidoglycan/LPS O-acetylase OafA/YrhL
LLVQSWSPNANIYGALNTPSWSISVEAFFYLLFPAVLYGLLRGFRGAGGRRVLHVATALCAAQILVLVAVQPTPFTAWVLYYFPPLRLTDFVVGMLIAIAFLRRRAAPGRSATAAEALCLLAAVGGIAVIPLLPQTLRYSAALVPLWALLISTFAKQSGAISRFLSHPWCVRLGEISFAFYMVHYVVLNAENHLLGWANVVLSLAVGLGATLALSFALFHWVETPMRDRIRRLGTPRPRTPRALAADPV